jgi:hypothetical protein
MSIISLLIIIALIVLGVIAIKFLVGMARTLVSLGLFLLAALLLIFVLTGNDPFGVGQAITGIVGKALSLG